ncbi:MAG: hypothetical protein GY749_10010 [Desulfobacteraceae bacterium]|nr:hypothetical protein [Desulfobacteraceae bacterium]
MLGHLIKIMPEKEVRENESWEQINKLMTDVSKKMTVQNVTPSETAVFVFSLKDAIFPVLQDEFSDKTLAEDIMAVNQLIDTIGLNTFEVYLESREEIIADQQKAFREAHRSISFGKTNLYCIFSK